MQDDAEVDLEGVNQLETQVEALKEEQKALQVLGFVHDESQACRRKSKN